MGAAAALKKKRKQRRKSRTRLRRKTRSPRRLADTSSQRNRGNNRRNGGRATERYHKPYAEVVKENDKLQTYYNGLLQLNEGEACADEREAFWAAFRRELPHSFRFCGSKGHAMAVQKLLQTRYIPELATMTHYDGLPVSPPQPVPWYPDSLAWWMTTSKTVIRKFPPFAAFQRFLVSETSVGNISRQEVVSMIPPLLMDVRPGMAVLDLCAAPGSKAAQLLEMVHQGEEARVRKVMRSIEKSLGGEGGGEGQKEEEDDDDDDDDDEDPAAQLSADPSDDGRATGILVANDSDYKRSHLLIHQLKRLSSPNIIVTNHDATIYPSLRLPPLPQPSDAPSSKRQPTRYLKFDRILADVPCSGDGTLRKNITLWKDWNPGNALGLHLTQVRILVRALQMLKPGGRVVYSTCSLNPVENESVVAAAIAQCGGPAKVAILDNGDQLPLLQRRPGLTTWPVVDKSGREWRSWAEVEAFVASDESAGTALNRVVPTMFANEASAQLPLERCLRVYPHLQDTGGFFIVVLEKRAEFKATTVSAGVPATKKQEKQAKQEVVSAAEAAETAENGDTNGADLTRSDEDGSAESRPAKKPQVEAGEAPQEAAAAEAVAADTGDLKRLAEDGSAEKRSAKKPRVEVGEAPQEEAAAEAAAAETAEEPADEAAEPTPAAEPRRKPAGPYEEPFKYLAADHAVVRDIQAFYHLSPRFPADRFMVRNAYGEPAKAIYYTSGLVRDVLVSNSSASSGGGGVKFVHGGVRMFVKQEAPSAEVCRWRIQAEGLPLLAGYVGTERVVRLRRKATLKALLVEMFPKFSDGGWRALGEVGERLPELGMGCFVLKVEPDEKEAADAGDGDVPLEPMALPLWKSFHSLNLMLPKEDRAAMLLRIYNDTTPLVNNALRDKKAADTTPAGEDAEEKLDTTMVDAGDIAVTPSSEPVAAPGGQTNGSAEVNDYDAEDAPSS